MKVMSDSIAKAKSDSIATLKMYGDTSRQKSYAWQNLFLLDSVIPGRQIKGPLKTR
jgi:hypothetical protein